VSLPVFVCSHHNTEKDHQHHNGLEEDGRNDEEATSKDDEEDDDDDESIRRARAWDDWKDGNKYHDTQSRTLYDELV